MRVDELSTRALAAGVAVGAVRLVAVAAAAVLSLQLCGDRVGRWLTVVQAITPWVLPVVTVAGITAAALGRHRSGLATGLIGAAYLVLLAPLIAPGSLPSGDPSHLSLVHANVLYSNPRSAELIAVLAERDADVLALSELTPRLAAEIEGSELGRRYPYRVMRPGDAAIGLGILSKRPLDPAEVSGATMAIGAEIELAGRQLRVVLAHPLPPLFNSRHWRHEMDALALDAARHGPSSAMVADLNVSYFHPPYRSWLDATGYADVHQAFGEGLSFSWPTNEIVPPFVRLDHALVGDDVTATSIDDFELPGGDHMAFEVTIAWASE